MGVAGWEVLPDGGVAGESSITESAESVLSPLGGGGGCRGSDRVCVNKGALSWGTDGGETPSASIPD